MKVFLEPGAYMPERAHETDAGFDLRSREEKTIYPAFSWSSIAESCVFDTGVHIEIPRGCYGKIEGRSGLNIKQSIVCCGGVIDESYTGSIKVKLYNLGNVPYVVHIGDKIAQLIIQPYFAPALQLSGDFRQSKRGDNGFGGTGR